MAPGGNIGAPARLDVLNMGDGVGKVGSNFLTLRERGDKSERRVDGAGQAPVLAKKSSGTGRHGRTFPRGNLGSGEVKRSETSAAKGRKITFVRVK